MSRMRRQPWPRWLRQLVLAAVIWLLSLAVLMSGCAVASHTASNNGTATPADAGTLYFGDDGIYALRARDGTVRWHVAFAPQGEIGNGSPVLADGTLYVVVADAPNDLAALDASTGQVRWRVRVPLATPDVGLTGKLIVANGVLYIGTSRPHDTRPSPPEGALYALSASDGRVLWRTTILDSLVGLPVVADGVVYLVDGTGADTSLFALRAEDGHILWRSELGSVPGTTIGLTPAVADGMLYLGTRRFVPNNDPNAVEQDTLLALRASDGQQLWHVPTDGWVTAPVVADGMLYATSAQQTVYAFDARAGMLRWRFSMEHLPPDTPTTGFPPTIADGVVYAGAFGGGVFALSARDGTQRWLALPRARGAGESEAIVQTLLVASETVYVGTQPFPRPGFDQSYDGTVYALKVSDGTRLWSYHSETSPFAPLLFGP